MFGKFALMLQKKNLQKTQLDFLFITHHLPQPLFLFVFLPGINNSQTTLVRFYIVSNTDEVLPPAMSE